MPSKSAAERVGLKGFLLSFGNPPAKARPGRKTLYYLPWKLTVSISLALLALAFGAVGPREIPTLLDLRLLELFFVLILAAECARISRGLDVVVHLILSRVRSERTLALAAVLLAPSAAAGGGGPLFTALLYGVNAGGCGTPIASIANLVGADLYLRGRVGRRRFWTPFLAVSGILLAAAILLSLFLVRLTP